jgi:excisionase family DNA binding protein
MRNSTIIHEVSPDEIANLFHGLQQQLKELKMNLEPKKPTELLTRNEVAELLKVDLSTIHNWCKKNKLIPFGIGNRIYFKRSDIESALVNLGKKKGDDHD